MSTMTLGELLKVEIWSKETTRKITFACGIVLIFTAIEQYWLTPVERRSGRAALVQIDTLQNFGSMNGRDFKVKLAQARSAVEAAENAAWTGRDKKLAAGLGAYLSLTEVDQSNVSMRQLVQQRDPALASKNGEFESKLASSGEKIRLALRLQLHRYLD